MDTTLHLKKELTVPVDAECIRPDIFAGKAKSELCKLPVWEGNRKRPLNQIFDLQGDCENTPSDVTISLFGDLSKVRRIGLGMTAGQLLIQGDAGMHLGEEMEGGKITVEGNVGSWVGSAMRGGTIEVGKNAGDYVGGPYRGSRVGMRGGNIVIHGNAGTEVGRYMRKGMIEIHGDVGQFVGVHMRKGTILVHGNAEGRAGAYMTGGKIIVCGEAASVLPTFTFDSVKSKAKAGAEAIKEPFYLFTGDLAEHGTGKLYISKTKNPSLKDFEKLLQ